jgi:hypothetical protein
MVLNEYRFIVGTGTGRRLRGRIRIYKQGDPETPKLEQMTLGKIPGVDDPISGGYKRGRR